MGCRTGMSRAPMTERITQSARARITSVARLSFGVFCRLTMTSLPPAPACIKLREGATESNLTQYGFD